MKGEREIADALSPLYDNKNKDADDNDNDGGGLGGGGKDLHVSICGTADVFHCCPTKKQMSEATLCNRLCVASFAVVLLWMSSLRVALSIVQWVIVAPTTDAVYSSCSYAYQVSADERNSYVECVDRQVKSCGGGFDKSISESLEAVLSNGDYNTALLQSARSIQAACSTAATTAQAALGSWQEGGTGHLIHYDTDRCPSKDPADCKVHCSIDTLDANASCTCDAVTSMISDISSVRSEAFTHATSYAELSLDVVGSLARYSSDRAAYDAEYVYNHTAGLRGDLSGALKELSRPHIRGINASFAGLIPEADMLISCVSLRDAENYSACGIESVRDRYEEAMGRLEAQINAAREGFAEYSSEAAAFVDEVADAFTNMRDFYEGFSDWVLAVGIDTETLGDWFNFGLEDFVVADPVWPSSVGILDVTSSIPGANSIWEAVSHVFDDFLANVSLASLGTHKLARQWFEDISALTEGFPGFTPDDYSPPQYSDYTGDGATTENVTEARKKHEQQTNEFVAKEAVALNAFAELESYEDGGGYVFSGFNFSISDDAYTLNGLYFPFEPLQRSTLNVHMWLMKITDLSGLLVWFDYAYRAHQSLCIFARFWSRSGLEIPDVDMRVDRGQVKLMFMRPGHLLIHVATSPAVFFVIGLGAALIFIVYLVQIYLPIFNEYADGCVKGATNGTFVSANLYSIAYNYASADGNEDALNGLSEYNIEKADYCSSFATSTQEQQNEDELYIRSLKASQKSMRDNVFLMSQCLDDGTMDDLFKAACCGGGAPYDSCSVYGSDDAWSNSSLVCPVDTVFDSPFKPLSEYLTEAACLEPSDWDDWELKDAVFHCGDVPDCVITCSGPSPDLLKAVTEQCGCTAEWLFHSTWFRFSIATTIYILMNASRALFVSALCKLLWKHLSPGIFTYRATCDHRGSVLAPREAEKVECFTGPHGSLKRQLDRTLMRFVTFAWAQVALAAMLNMPWIYFLQAVQHDIQYDP